MKVLSRFRTIMLVALAMAIFSPCVEAQVTNIPNLNFSVDVSPTSVPANNNVTYTINIANNTGNTLFNFFVTNLWSAPVTLIGSPQITLGVGTTAVASNSVAFLFNAVNPSQSLQMTVTVAPTNSGSLADLVLAGSNTATNFAFTNMASTNVVIQVTNTANPTADLTVSLVPPTFPALVNDRLSYIVVVSNRGPATASNVILSNSFRPFTNLVLVSASPSGSFTNGTIVLNLGTMTNNTSRTFRLVVRPTAAGTLPFFTSVSASGITEINAANNTSSATNSVSDLVLGQLIATNLTILKFNPQTSLMEQKIRVSNISSSNVQSARVIVLGLTNWLFNAVGTNDFSTNGAAPFVIYGAPLNAGESADLLMEYVVPSRKAVDVTNDYSYVAVGAGAFTGTSPGGGTNTSFEITGFVLLTNGATLIEFVSTPGRSYSVIYSSDASFSTALVAEPPIIAQADRTQWIDDGPPKTVSPPTPPRFYRIRQNNP